MVATPDPSARLAVRHARWRWSGAPLLVSGVLITMTALGTIARGGSVFTLIMALFGTGMALASFGANHDSAIAMAVRARAHDASALPTGLSRELDEELERDRSGTLALHASPKVALVMPFVAVAVQLYAAWLLAH